MYLRSKISIGQGGLTLIAFALGTLLALANIPALDEGSRMITEVFMRLLHLTSLF